MKYTVTLQSKPRTYDLRDELVFHHKDKADIEQLLVQSFGEGFRMVIEEEKEDE